MVIVPGLFLDFSYLRGLGLLLVSGELFGVVWVWCLCYWLLVCSLLDFRLALQVGYYCGVSGCLCGGLLMFALDDCGMFCICGVRVGCVWL